MKTSFKDGESETLENKFERMKERWKSLWTVYWGGYLGEPDVWTVEIITGRDKNGQSIRTYFRHKDIAVAMSKALANSRKTLQSFKQTKDV